MLLSTVPISLIPVHPFRMLLILAFNYLRVVLVSFECSAYTFHVQLASQLQVHGIHHLSTLPSFLLSHLVTVRSAHRNSQAR
jgi:hypothetical protein